MSESVGIIIVLLIIYFALTQFYAASSSYNITPIVGTQLTVYTVEAPIIKSGDDMISVKYSDDIPRGAQIFVGKTKLGNVVSRSKKQRITILGLDRNIRGNYAKGLTATIVHVS